MKDKFRSLEEGLEAFNGMDYATAFRLLLPLAEAGIAEAQCVIASMYQAGFGTSINGPQAVSWYLKAAKQGHPLSLNNLGTIYNVGMPGVPPDPEKASEYYCKASELGFEMIPRH